MFLTFSTINGWKIEDEDSVEVFAALLARFVIELNPTFDSDEAYEEIVDWVNKDIPEQEFPKLIGAGDLDGLATRIKALNDVPPGRLLC